LGRVVIEGMGCKIAVVGSNSGAIPEVIGPGGCIFPEDDWGTLASVIDDLASQPEKRQTLAELGYQRVMENYTVERLAEDVWCIWQSLVE
jgi:L-malate glycosyltransferase